MRKDNREERQESGKVMALTMALMKILIVSVVLGMIWLAQFLMAQHNQLFNILRGSTGF